jgi:hypothetical protein
MVGLPFDLVAAEAPSEAGGKDTTDAIDLDGHSADSERRAIARDAVALGSDLQSQAAAQSVAPSGVAVLARGPSSRAGLAMISPRLRARIRRLFFAEHWKVGTIATELGVHRDTVRSRDYDWNWPTRIDRPRVEAAVQLDFFADHRNVVLVAPQGLGKVVSRRYERKSLVLTTNLSFQDWPSIFPNATCATALIDRVTHHADVLAIEGESYRLREAEKRAGKTEGAKRP